MCYIAQYYEEACKQFEKSLSLDKNFSQLNWLGLSLALKHSNKQNEAEQWYKRAVDEMGSNPVSTLEDWIELQILRGEAEEMFSARSGNIK